MVYASSAQKLSPFTGKVDTNENTNDLLRFFFPKGYNFHTLSEEHLRRVTDMINNRPRKCLGWKSPSEVFFSQGVALA